MNLYQFPFNNFTNPCDDFNDFIIMSADKKVLYAEFLWKYFLFNYLISYLLSLQPHLRSPGHPTKPPSSHILGVKTSPTYPSVPVSTLHIKT